MQKQGFTLHMKTQHEHEGGVKKGSSKQLQRQGLRPQSKQALAILKWILSPLPLKGTRIRHRTISAIHWERQVPPTSRPVPWKRHVLHAGLHSLPKTLWLSTEQEFSCLGEGPHLYVTSLDFQLSALQTPDGCAPCSLVSHACRRGRRCLPSNQCSFPGWESWCPGLAPNPWATAPSAQLLCRK